MYSRRRSGNLARRHTDKFPTRAVWTTLLYTLTKIVSRTHT